MKNTLWILAMLAAAAGALLIEPSTSCPPVRYTIGDSILIYGCPHPLEPQIIERPLERREPDALPIPEEPEHSDEIVSSIGRR